MRILFVASECFPLIKTGGLADVIGALPLALDALGMQTQVFLPGFPSVLAGLKSKKKFATLKNIAGGPARIVSGKSATGLSILALDAPHLFDVSGNPYQDDKGNDRPDNAVKFAVFAKVAADLASGRIGKTRYDVLHAHDWQTGLASAYIKAMGEKDIKTVFTIHNLAFQGNFPSEIMAEIGLPEDMFNRDGLEYWEKVSYMKSGLTYSDHITTVSPTYALEIQSDDGGMGFGGLLKSRSHSLSGILNGIDLDVWNPETDPEIASGFSAKAISGKAKNKAALQKRMGLRRAKNVPLFSVISRLTTQKGLDVLAQLVDQIVLSGGQLALLGSGDDAIEAAFLAAAKKHPTEVGVQIGYDEPLAHLIQAGADATFIPSRFEPCGLTQLCAMRYGTVPIAGRVGGLNDTIIDASPAALVKGVATGILFSPITTHTLSNAISRAFSLYQSPKTWAQMRKNAITHPVGWDKSAKAYMDLYSKLLNPS
ncbi:MAG: glycogen synthase GlgA [Hyphomonadaceae bacterium]|nr:glycogen synthase GlgA [Hyphomonadaceae bacterium]